MRRVRAVVLVLLVGLIAWLLLAPVNVEPAAWSTPPKVAMDGVYAPNQSLKNVEWWAKQLVGPEAITFAPDGGLVTGLRDGRVVRLQPNVDTPELLVKLKGRPLAIEFDATGRLLVCDAHDGLLAVSADGGVETLASEFGGVPFRFTDDMDIGKDGTIYFSDASARHSIEEFTEDLIEHQTTGRLLKYVPETKQLSLLADGFSFSNGVALGPDESYVVVAETGGYQLWRVWLKGPQTGKKEPFGDPLPGFPDNLSYSPQRHVFWLAIGSRRNGLIDSLAKAPWARKVIARLPKFVQPKPERFSFVVAIDENGKPVQSLQYDNPGSYSPIASVIEKDGWLYLGSFAREGVARYRLPK